MRLASPAFQDHQRIPVRFTGEGENVSPPLHWDDVPIGTKEFALLCEDPDAHSDRPFVHWVAYKIPAHLNALGEGAGAGGPYAIMQGRNSMDFDGYVGPLPPPQDQAHRYVFKLFALGTELPAREDLSRDEILALIEDNILEEADLIGLYERGHARKRRR